MEDLSDDSAHEDIFDDDFEFKMEFSNDEAFLAFSETYNQLRQAKNDRMRERSRGGSCPGKRGNRARDFEGRWQRFYQLFFAPSPIYSEEQFRRRFRMRRTLFLRVCNAVIKHDSYFSQKRDCTGKLGILPLMKITAAMRVLAYGCCSDSLDEALEISESVVSESVERFTRAIIQVFGPHFLRAPTPQDYERLLDENARRGFPGMVGSLDCMKWIWQNCSTSWRGSFQGKSGKPTVVLEAIASYDLYIWHAFIGMPGASNDINVMDASPLIAEYLDDKAPAYSYTVNGSEYNFVYWLTDGIYPEWKCFVKTIAAPIGEIEKNFSKAQAALRKDVERAFGVLQARFAIVARPVKFWTLGKISDVMKCCVILHNMIVTDDQETGRSTSFSCYQVSHGVGREEMHRAKFTRIPTNEREQHRASFLSRFKDVQSASEHAGLRNNLMKHLWERRRTLMLYS